MMLRKFGSCFYASNLLLCRVSLSVVAVFSSNNAGVFSRRPDWTFFLSDGLATF